MGRKRGFLFGNRRRKSLFVFILFVVAIAYFLRREEVHFQRPEESDKCSGTAGCFTGIVNRVIDGDTLEVNSFRIRLVLVDASEWNAAGGTAATSYLRQLCPVGSQALVDQDDRQHTDNYGRLLAVVWCGGKRVNEEILREGHARIYRRFCSQSEFGDQPWAVGMGCP
ncbi:MAG: thermonuclease family protein [Acidobacteria bacterium]|nr:thermonuclease family protein [Acidobacteriota bacterium]